MNLKPNNVATVWPFKVSFFVAWQPPNLFYRYTLKSTDQSSMPAFGQIVSTAMFQSSLNKEVADAARRRIERKFNSANWCVNATIWRGWLLQSALVSAFCSGRTVVMSAKNEHTCAVIRWWRVEGTDASRSPFHLATWDSGAARPVLGEGWILTLPFLWMLKDCGVELNTKTDDRCCGTL